MEQFENFKKYMQELKDLGLPEDQYAVSGSGPLAVRGIRDVHDLDIIVKPELWEYLCRQYNKENDRLIKIGNIDIYREWKPYFRDVDALISDADLIDEIRFIRFDDILKWKKAMNKPKDREDVRLIEEYTKKQNKGEK